MPKIQIKYLKPQEWQTQAVNGAVGAVSTKNLIQLDFYLERADVAVDHEIEIDDNGVGKLEAQSVAVMLREIKGSYVMTSRVAREIGKWLVNKADEAEKMVVQEEVDLQKLNLNQKGQVPKKAGKQK